MAICWEMEVMCVNLTCSFLLLPCYPSRKSLQYVAYNDQDHCRKTIWSLEERFPVLSIGLRCNVDKALTIIVATDVLHNMAIASRENYPPEDVKVTRLLQELQNQGGYNIEDDEPVNANHLM